MGPMSNQIQGPPFICTYACSWCSSLHLPTSSTTATPFELPPSSNQSRIRKPRTLMMYWLKGSGQNFQLMIWRWKTEQKKRRRRSRKWEDQTILRNIWKNRSSWPPSADFGWPFQLVNNQWQKCRIFVQTVLTDAWSWKKIRSLLIISSRIIL